MKPYYEEDGITIYCADCREVLPTLPKVDLVLTDPPYGINFVARQGGTIRKGKFQRRKIWDDIHGDEDDSIGSEVLSICLGICSNLVAWGGNFFAHSLPPSRGWLYWDKQTTGTYSAGEIAWTSLDIPLQCFRHMWNGAFKESERGIERDHPTQKPIALMEWCLSYFPNAQTILDPFMGSGTTLVAAKKLDRKAIGIEINQKYCDIAIKRLKNTTPSLFREEK